MASTQKKGTGRKKAPAPPPPPAYNAAARLVGGIVCALLALCVLVSYFNVDALLLTWIARVLRGTLGWGYYLTAPALAAVAVNFAPLFYGDDFAYSGTLMMPLAFTLLSIGFANVIRTQWVLPQGRDTIFVHSVLTGAVINLIANFVLIPPFGAMGAAAATVLAEFSVPAVQFVYLRKELPYAQYLKTTGVYCLFGLVMAGVVALLGHVLPLHGWGKLAVQVIGGAAVYGALCLTYWKLAKRSDIFRLMRRK